MMDNIKVEYIEEFKEIQPFRGEAFLAALKRVQGHQMLIDGICAVVLPNAIAPLRAIFRFGIKHFLKYKLRNIKDHDDLMNGPLTTIIETAIKKTMTECTWSGVDQIDPAKKYLFISNHRDIVLDPSLAIYILAKNNLPTFETAFGNNLLMGDLISDFIRLNKSFIVKRGQSPREQFASTVILSKYIWYILNNIDSVWIAQKEGRAKDGDDFTNPAIIKMFFLSQRKDGFEFSDFINRLNLIPISVSYEFDPCDKLKARELYRRDLKEVYEKRKGEDFISIVQGIREFKGRVHVAFGKPLKGEWSDAKEVAEALDKFIHTNYKLWTSNYVAYDMYHNTNKYSSKYSEKDKYVFLRRFRRLPEDVEKYALAAYAKPVENAEKY